MLLVALFLLLHFPSIFPIRIVSYRSPNIYHSNIRIKTGSMNILVFTSDAFRFDFYAIEDNILLRRLMLLFLSARSVFMQQIVFAGRSIY